MKRKRVITVLFTVVLQQLTLMKAFTQSAPVQDQSGISSIWIILAMIAAAIVFMLIDKARKKK